MKIAIVHDFLTYWGGAEQVLLSLHRLWPEAPIYTLIYDEEFTKKYFPSAKIKGSFLQKFPNFLRRRKKYLLPLLAVAPETFDLEDFDLVISSSSSFAKGVVVKPKTIHICYCHTPTRFLWDWRWEYLRENNIGGVKKIFAIPILHYLRMWDKSVADRIDYFIANSAATKKRIEKFYRRDSRVIYPPADTNKFKVQSSPKEPLHDPAGRAKFKVKERDYFLIVSRLSPYKKIDAAIEAFNKLDWPLVIVGEGSHEEYLRRIAGKNIKFAGFVEDEKLAGYYQSAKALIFPGEDDFGITAIEAMASGAPVIALRRGGARETVIEGVTGEFFDYPVAPLVADAVMRFMSKESEYSAEAMRAQAAKFSRQIFEKNMKEYVEKILEMQKNEEGL